ncbi:MAG: hypothetical protein AAGJ81_15780, partial [Verrucomicrobiota bacterium]
NPPDISESILSWTGEEFLRNGQPVDLPYQIISEQNSGSGGTYGSWYLSLLKVELDSDKAASGDYFGEEDVRIDPVILRNPQIFGEIASDDIDPCDRQRKDPALVVFYEDVIDQDYDVENFDVTLRAVTSGLPGSFQWEKVRGPDSGSLEDANMSKATYANPKTGGLYQFDVDVGGQKIRTSLLLPLAGADITEWFQAEAASIGPWARSHLRATEDANYSMVPFVTRYQVFKTWSLISGSFFDYTLDPVDSEERSPCRRYQSTIRRGGEYGYVTVNGYVIHGSKINLALWSLFGNHWGYSHFHLVAGGHVNSILRGKGLDSSSAGIAIYLGSQLYRHPDIAIDDPIRELVLRLMQSDEDLIEEKLWPSPYPMDPSKSTMNRPDPDLPTTAN